MAQAFPFWTSSLKSTHAKFSTHKFTESGNVVFFILSRDLTLVTLSKGHVTLMLGACPSLVAIGIMEVET